MFKVFKEIDVPVEVVEVDTAQFKNDDGSIAYKEDILLNSENGFITISHYLPRDKEAKLFSEKTTTARVKIYVNNGKIGVSLFALN